MLRFLTLRGRMTARNATVPEVTFSFNPDKLDIAVADRRLAAEAAREQEQAACTTRFEREIFYRRGHDPKSGVALNRVHPRSRSNNGVLASRLSRPRSSGGKKPVVSLLRGAAGGLHLIRSSPEWMRRSCVPPRHP